MNTKSNTVSLDDIARMRQLVTAGDGWDFRPSSVTLASLLDLAEEALRLRAAAEPEAKAPVCDHGRPPTRMVPCRKVDGAWACETCGSQCYDPENPSKAARPEAKCMGMIPGTAFMCGEMAGYYCPNCRREDDR